MSMKDTLQDALDDISSPSASSSRRSRALAVVEQQLALACAPNIQDDTMHHFLELQDTFECNIPARTLCWVQTAASRVDTLAGRATSDHREAELNAICSQLHQLLSVIQGLALHHIATKVYLGRRYSLEVLVALLASSRHTPMFKPSFTGDPTVGQPSDKTSSVVHLSSAVLDTMLCVLVDSSVALRVFEDIKGLQAVVKLLKRAGTPREVRMKCLEFLYFYLMDETTTYGEDGTSLLGMPSTPVATQVRTPTRQAGPRIFERPASGASSSSLGSSGTSSTSGFAFSMTMNSSESSMSSIRTASPVKKSYSTPTTMVTDPLQTPPNSPLLRQDERKRMSLRTLSARSMMMLEKEVDYEPQSPKKAHGSWVYVDGNSTPGVGGKCAGDVMEKRGVRVRTTEEKKELLGTFLGNVDALVEGVRKAGIWGLT